MVDELKRWREEGVGVPGGGAWVAGAVVAPCHRHSTHAGSARGLDVAQVVAQIEAILRGSLQFFRGKQQPGGMRLEMRRAVTAHNAVGSQAKRFDDSVGEARSLVGDDAPGDVAALEFMQEFRHAREKSRVDANA